ncbi:MAG: DEAD/DEAH box helicase family protein [Nitrospira sp.]|nr:DEAD/DEAH box helicase family protein [Nitrospira sp.]
MKFLLREFQKAHVSGLLKKLKQAKRDLLDDSVPQAITLSAPTASGKTVMMTALIERVLFGKGGLEDFDDPDFTTEPHAVFLWLSDSPQLNQQSLEKMIFAGSAELSGRLGPVEATFDAEHFQPGHVYFLNSQKLSVAGLLTKKGDGRQFSIWETINNTIARQKGRFYVVIDEAHRGMRRTQAEQTQAKSIVQKFIFGNPGEVNAAPIIIGISATPERFNTLLAQSGRTRRVIDIPPHEPREAGLIKDCILISHTDDDQPTEWTLLVGACGEFDRISKEWASYCKSNNEQDTVRPVLVIQIQDADAGGADTESRTSLAKLVEIVKANVPNLTSINFAHCLESGKVIQVAGTDIRYVEPHRIEHDQSVRVVIFKMALTTGWDCPRAEVMMSFRKAEDATYIAQLVGRIVRTPLARRMEGNDLLNSVMLFLPHYDREQVQTVVERLQAEGESGGAEAGDTHDFQTLKVAKDKEHLLDIYRTLPTYAAQEGRKVAHIRRALRMALELAKDGWEDDSLTMRNRLRAKLAVIGDTRRKDHAFVRQIEGLSIVSYRMLRVENGALKPDELGEQRSLPVTEQDVETVFSRSFVTLTEELAMSYVQHRFDPKDENAVYWRCKLEAFLLSQDASVVSPLEDEAQKLLEAAYEKRKPEVLKLPDERRAAYRRIMQTSRDFKATEPSIPDPLRIKTDKDAVALKDHLFIPEKGDFRAWLNTWETTVLAAARKGQGFAGWLRNYPRKPWSIAYIYTNSEGQITPGYPDLVVFRREGKHVVVDLLEPHHTGNADSLAKVKGLCRFAEQHGDKFGRIEWIKIEGSQIKRLNVNSTQVRANVQATNVDSAIDSLFEAHGTSEAAPPGTGQPWL